MNAPLLSVQVRTEQDVVLTRQRARQIAQLLGFGRQDQTSFATTVSEIARNAFRYAGGGRAEFMLDTPSSGRDPQAQTLIVRVSDQGPGIPHLSDVLGGSYQSKTGMGIGIVGSKRLSDEFDIQSTPGQGTTVTMGRRLPRRAAPVTPQGVAGIAADLARSAPRDALEEVQLQNKELMSALEALRARQDEVERLNAELAETNRGVLALYAELDEKAESLRRASESKSRFLSDMTHELRTPLNAMVSLSRLLLDRTDGELTPEQEKQVTFIRRSAESLGELVNDLLDLAKIEAGKSDLRVTSFDIADVLAALRGMFRPILGSSVSAPAVALRVDEPPPGVPSTLRTDEGKLAQILRNLVSNAIKFTEAGEVRVRVEARPDARIAFEVSDTGVGIAPDDLERIFEDYSQVDGPVQRRFRGTGLGLPLTRKLARLLGGDVTVQSRVGEGSTFTLTVPVDAPAPAAVPPATAGRPHGEGVTTGARPYA